MGMSKLMMRKYDRIHKAKIAEHLLTIIFRGHLLYHMHKETLFSEHQARFYIAGMFV